MKQAKPRRTPRPGEVVHLLHEEGRAHQMAFVQRVYEGEPHRLDLLVMGVTGGETRPYTLQDVSYAAPSKGVAGTWHFVEEGKA